MAYDSFIQIDSIQGESTDEKHKNWIAVFAFSHGVAQTGAGSVSSVGSRVSGKCDHQDFHFTKRMDKSSPYLHKFCCSGKHFPTAVVEICMNTGAKETFMKWTFSDVVISSVSTGGGQGSDFPMENVSFNYSKVKWEYTPIDVRTGAKGGNVATDWDLTANKGA